ncbi:GntR family transcriptional regulator [Mesorhizobium sp. ES1-1]|uniref:GntR family transcriptional regulator n=1 Tax=Mesorhizobium sp. ES1-1 TaxID=2876629 RepID=UPI001CCFF076|nr:GntR family transcriptional regulator [Mesorhizobium sp. ES1-1]MBZ9675026.1 GntR family transcriptional regulator [Mesorhizobium sp. ES1-1]
MATKISGEPSSPTNAPKPRAEGQRGPARALEPVNNRMPISPQIYERLRRAITTLTMLPSEALSEQDLAKQLGVSRTPVREALIRLADEGLIDILPQRGSFVAPIRLSDVEEAQFIREALEVSVVQKLAGHGSQEFLATARANLARQAKAVAEGDRELFLELDEAFHRSLSEEAGLPKSWRVIQVVKLQMDRVRYLSLPEPGHLETLLAQHVAIFEAVEAGEAKQAGARMTAHLREVLRTVQRLSVARPDLFGR